MHSYIRMSTVVETVLRQIHMSLAHNNQENIDKYLMKNKEKIIYIYIIVMKDDDEIMF